MKILVTGATGFIGQHLVPALLAKNVSVIATYRDDKITENIPWSRDVEWKKLDVFSPPSTPYTALGSPDRMIHLAWNGLPNFREDYHVKKNLPADKRFLTSMIKEGLKHLLVTGTCFEYGMTEGELTENIFCDPTTSYGQAKIRLLNFLRGLEKQYEITLQWTRLFYMFGVGQNENSLFAQLQKAIDNKDPAFKMSGGQQIRDFLPVTSVARHLAAIVMQDKVTGAINVASGKKIRLQTLVEEFIIQQKAQIELKLGEYPYPDWEPFQFWADINKLRSVPDVKI